MANFPVAGIFFVGLGVAILVGLLRIFIVRRNSRNLESIWPELRGDWATPERRGKAQIILVAEPVLSEALLELNKDLVSLPLAVTFLPPTSPCDPLPPSSSLPNTSSSSPSPSPSLLLSVLILQPLPPEVPLDDSSDLPEIAIGSRLIGIELNEEEEWRQVALESRLESRKAAERQEESTTLSPPSN